MGHFLVRHALLIKCELRMAVYKPTRPVSFSAGLEVRNSLFTTKTCFTILFLFFFFSFFFSFFFLLLSRPTPTALLYESVTVKLFPFVNLFNPPRVNSTYFFLQCHPRITLTHEGHEKKRK